MVRLLIRHKTAYAYQYAVSFGAHRLLLRPRESRDLRIISHEVTLSAPGRLSWALDVFGNTVGLASFTLMSDRLVIDSVSEIELDAPHWPVFDISASALTYPFVYSPDVWIDLGALTTLQYVDPQFRLSQWARGFVAGPVTDTLSLLKDLSLGVTAWVAYESREVEGTQTPCETLDRRVGSCRDMAVLFIEAARALGFGARIVSGYLHNPDRTALGVTDAGCTHAWAEIFVPGAGWITFDPTNRSIGGANLIPIAVARNIDQVIPVAGEFVGPGNASLGMQVEVDIRVL